MDATINHLLMKEILFGAYQLLQYLLYDELHVMMQKGQCRVTIKHLNNSNE